MKVRSYEKDGVAVIEPSGKLMGGTDTGELDEKLYALLGRGQLKVVLDLGRTEWMNSSGIAILIHHWRLKKLPSRSRITYRSSAR